MTAADTREARTRVALAATGWAYLAAKARGDELRAVEALKAFQTLFTANRSYVVSGFVDRAVAESSLPFLAVDGRLGPSTRNALAGAIFVADHMYFGGSRDFNTSYASQLLEGDPAAFYRANASQSAAMGGDDFDALVRGLPVNKVYQALLTEANSVIRDEPAVVPGVAPDGSGTPRVDITDALDIGTQRARFRMPTWGWWAIGIGLTTAAGIVGWGLWTKYKRKRGGK